MSKILNLCYSMYIMFIIYSALPKPYSVRIMYLFEQHSSLVINVFKVICEKKGPTKNLDCLIKTQGKTSLIKRKTN
jgi:hypothetical protein